MVKWFPVSIELCSKQKVQDLKYISRLNFVPDRENLFVPSAIHFELVYLRPDRPAVVPCRVTEPQVEASLHREVPPEEITANQTLLTFDPTKGFILQNPSADLQGVFYCKASSKGTPQISTKYQLLYVEGEGGQKYSYPPILFSPPTFCCHGT